MKTHQKTSKWLAISCAILLPLSLIPAGFSFYVHETHGRGFAHELNVWGTFFLLLLMPVVLALGIFISWRAYKRNNDKLVKNWSIFLGIVLMFWGPKAWMIYLS